MIASPPQRMALFPFSKRRGADTAPASAAEQVRHARTRARQRLIGALLLLGIGVIGFPLLFETQPRPIPVDIAIEIPRRDAQPPLTLRDPPPAKTPAPEPMPADAGAPPSAEPARPLPPPMPEAPRDTAAAADDGARARALLEGGPAAAPDVVAAAKPPAAVPPDAAAPRFVVQVGAFADRAAAQRTRQRVEELGLKTYTQVVNTGEGERTRVRVGPYGSRDDADKAAARLKSAGLTAAVLTL
jgi:DedD protein